MLKRRKETIGRTDYKGEEGTSEEKRDGKEDKEIIDGKGDSTDERKKVKKKEGEKKR